MALSADDGKFGFNHKIVTHPTPFTLSFLAPDQIRYGDSFEFRGHPMFFSDLIIHLTFLSVNVTSLIDHDVEFHYEVSVNGNLLRFNVISGKRFFYSMFVFSHILELTRKNFSDTFRMKAKEQRHILIGMSSVGTGSGVIQVTIFVSIFHLLMLLLRC